MTKAILIDITKCLDCNACTQACKMANNVPEGVFRTQIHHFEAGVYPQVTVGFMKHACKHCVEPACVEICPVNALSKTAEGPVVCDTDKCIGCQMCGKACPYGVPTYEQVERNGKTQYLLNKCTLCLDRADGGQGPACTESCPYGAAVSGDRDELLLQAYKRVKNYPDRYLPYVYGDTDGGGTSVLYISNIPFEDLGLPNFG